MKLEAKDFKGICVLEVQSPRIDAASAIRFKDLIREKISKSEGRVILDLKAVDFVDSSGLGAIVAAFKMLAPDRKLELSGLGQTVRKVFNLTRMDQVFTIHASLDDTVA